MFVREPGVTLLEAAALRASDDKRPARVEVSLVGDLKIEDEGGRYRGTGTIEVREYLPGQPNPKITREPLRTSLYNSEDDVRTAAELYMQRKRA